jgi:hypothetical protein
MPQYETKEMLAKEKALMERVAPKLGCMPEKNPKWYKIDFTLTRRGVAYAFAEAKCRDIRSDEYTTFFISMDKYVSMQQVNEITGLKTIILVEWLDKTGFVNVPCKYSHIRMGGRKDRGPNDWEPMVHIPVELFTML